MNINGFYYIPGWIGVENWIGRFEATIYYGIPNGPKLLPHARTLVNVQIDFGNLPREALLAAGISNPLGFEPTGFRCL
jgi:hypothetical protein